MGDILEEVEGPEGEDGQDLEAPRLGRGPAEDVVEHGDGGRWEGCSMRVRSARSHGAVLVVMARVVSSCERTEYTCRR